MSTAPAVEAETSAVISRDLRFYQSFAGLTYCLMSLVHFLKPGQLCQIQAMTGVLVTQTHPVLNCLDLGMQREPFTFR